jgi:surface polysaccharide O-acyltransferase-like enzyme
MQTTISINQSRLRWVDLIRALGAFLVVLAHIQYSGASLEIVRMIYYALTRVAVPLFFMVSGFLLLSKNESYSDFFRKRALKVFIPFIIWSLIYLLWKQEGFDQPLLGILKSYFLKIIRGPRENHLWFFYELFGLYLFTPILRLYVERASIKDLFYFCGLWFLLIPVANLTQEFTPIHIGFEYYFLNGYIGYFIFGYLAAKLKFNRSHKFIALAVFFVFLIATTTGIYLREYYKMQTQYFEDYLSVNVVLMSCSLFVALINMPVSDSIYRIVSPLSRASFGIYLAHVIVIAQLFAFLPFSFLLTIGNGIFMMPLLGLLGFVATFLLVFLVQKIPILSKIVP